jgi:hydroxyacylglutathione hydrolase
VILKQYYLGCLAHASYLIGDEKTRTAVVVDPQRDVDQYIEDATGLGLEIRHVFLTHFHADFLAGHLELRDRVGARICLGARAEAEFEFSSFGDGEQLEIGDLRLESLETPGHTPEGISILVYDLAADADKPRAVLTGDTLFIGDVGRPDLMASKGVTAEELAGMLYDSLHDKLLVLPDETLVYPAHGAGSLCGRNMSKETVSTMGDQRRYNYALQPMERSEFIRLITADQPEAPDYFAYDAELNRRERGTLETSLEGSLKPLPLEEVLILGNEGAQFVDTREPIEFAAGHLAGSTNIGLGGQYATWAGTLLHRDRPIVIVTDPGKEEESALRLGRIGLDHVAGYLEGGPEALVDHPELVVSLPRITAVTLNEVLANSRPPLVLDVRTPKEWQGGRIEGSLNIPLNRLPERIDEVPKDRPIVVGCASGYRSSIGASVLLNRGFREISDLVGGMNAWHASQLEMVSDPG